jgi:lambda family phage portal protein
VVAWPQWVRGLFGAGRPRYRGSRPQYRAFNPALLQSWAGDKFPGSWGTTSLYDIIDYDELRLRSRQLFRDNIYARGFVRRLVTNEINTGLTWESFPYARALGITDDASSLWAEEKENAFELWANDPRQCDFSGMSKFGELQKRARRQALVDGDVLVVLHLDPFSGLPRIQLIAASSVCTPVSVDAGARNIKHGVEVGANGEHLAFWVRNDDNTETRIPAYGAASGRKIAWLIYGSDMLLDEVRGEPFLAIMLYSLRDLDRYKDAAQRKALLNAMLALFVEKGEDRAGSNPFSRGAVRTSEVTALASDSTQRSFDLSKFIPGLYIEELQTGEKIVPHSTAGTDVNYGPFEESIIQALSWCAEIPPEIARLCFTRNYSASQAAINEFKMYLDMRRDSFGSVFCEPIKNEWLIGAHFSGVFSTPGFIESYLDRSRVGEFQAWTRGEWTGPVKPSTDLLKMARGLEVLVDHGWETNARAARTLTGSKFETNVARINRERQLMKAAGMLVEEGSDNALAAE